MINFMLNILMYKYKGAVLRYEDTVFADTGIPNYYIMYNNMKYTPFHSSDKNSTLLTNIPDLYFKYRDTRNIRFLPLFYSHYESLKVFINDVLIDPISITAHFSKVQMRFYQDAKRVVFDKPVYFADTSDYTHILTSGPEFLSNYFQPLKTDSIFDIHSKNIFACYIDGIARTPSSLLIRINIQNYDYDLITFNDNEYKSALELISLLTSVELVYDSQYVKLHINSELISSLSKYYKAFVNCINLDEDIFANTNNISEIGEVINDCVSI